MRWVSHSSAAEIWLRSPLPVALYEPGSTARTHMLDALQRTGVRHLCVHESNSVTGVLASVRAGTAVGAVPAQAAVGPVRLLGAFDGLAEIEPLDIIAAAGGTLPAGAPRLPRRAGHRLAALGHHAPVTAAAPRGTSGTAQGFGRTASAVPWMKARIFTTSSALSLPVKSGMPRETKGPLNSILSRCSIGPAPT